MLAERRSVWFGMSAARASSSPASRPTGAAGSPRRSSATRRSRRSSASTARPPKCRARAHRVRPVGDPARAAAPDRRGGRDRHGRRHAPGRRLDRHDRRARAHENNVIGTMNILAACGGPDSPVRKVVFKSCAHYYGCEQDDPAFFTEEMQPPAPAAHAARARHRRGRGGRRATSPSATRDVTVTVLRFANGLGPDLRDVAQPRCSACPPSRRSSASTRATSSSTRTTSSACLEHAVAPRPARRLQRAPPTACSCCRRSRACSASRSRRSCRRGGPGSPPRRCGALGVRIPPEMLQPAALRPRPRQPQAQGDRLPLRATRRARPSQRLARAPAPRAAPARRRGAATATSARSRSSCAAARASGRAPPRAGRAAARRRGGRRDPALDDLEAHEIIALLPSLDPAACGRCTSTSRHRARRRCSRDRAVAPREAPVTSYTSGVSTTGTDSRASRR